MPFKHKDELKFKISSTLFETEQGEPLCFYICPGPAKRELIPLIKAAGGLLSNVQKPGTILLKDPEERGSITESTADWYVSTKYIHDCIEKDERLNMEDYRLIQDSTKRRHNSKVGSPSISCGRTAYTSEEDDAILSYVCTRTKEIGGNKLWQEMAEQKVTNHTWQSMKYRYRVQLAHRLSEYQQADLEKENKMQNEAENENEERVSPQRISVETEEPDNSSTKMDLTQVSPSSESLDAQANVPQADCIDNKDCYVSMEKLEIDETPEQIAEPQRDIAVSEKDAQPAATREAKSAPNSVNRPTTRKQSELENMPYAKRLRSSGTPPEKSLFKCPHKQTSRTKNNSSPKTNPKEAQAPPKKVRRTSETNVAEQTGDESGQSDPSENTQTDEVNCPAPQPAVKRKLGILEMATKEFEDESESETDETPRPCTSTEAVISNSSNSVPSTILSGNHEEAVGPQLTTTTATTSRTTASVSAAAPPDSSNTTVREPTTRSNPPIEEVTSKAHLFIFESESQELDEDSQSFVAGPSTSAAVQANGDKNAQIPSLTQDQLEEDVQLLQALMKETSKDLVTVTKAILKASGDLILARELLMNPSSFSGPIWTPTEDQNLCSEDPLVRQELLAKYGEEGVAKRLMFLELDR